MNNKNKKQANKTEKDILEQFFAVYPSLRDDNNTAWVKLLECAQVFTAEPHMSLCEKEKRFLLLLEGNIRVYQLAPDGREVTLCRNNPGEVSIMSLSCMLNNEPMSAHFITETRIKALAFSSKSFFRALEVSQAFRLLVLNSVINTFSHMVDTFQETVFNRLEIRLSCLLKRLFTNAKSNELKITHQEIAHELGTTREVVSRILKQMEQHGCVKLSRGKIQQLDEQALPGFNSDGFCKM